MPSVPWESGARLDAAELTARYAAMPPRHDILERVPRDRRRVLDLGCANGATGAALKERQPCTVVGIEIYEPAAELARAVLDEVVAADIHELGPDAFPPASFDCAIASDILEHLRQPEETLRLLRSWLAPDGIVVAHLPNVAHYTVVAGLLRGRWAYADHGILDSSHLRFYTGSSLPDLFASAGFRVERVDPAYPPLGPLPRLASRLGGGRVRRHLATGYYAVARPA